MSIISVSVRKAIVAMVAMIGMAVVSGIGIAIVVRVEKVGISLGLGISISRSLGNIDDSFGRGSFSFNRSSGSMSKNGNVQGIVESIDRGSGGSSMKTRHELTSLVLAGVAGSEDRGGVDNRGGSVVGVDNGVSNVVVVHDRGGNVVVVDHGSGVVGTDSVDKSRIGFSLHGSDQSKHQL